MVRPLAQCRNHSLAGDCRGVAAVEFGILLPFLVILLAGVADLGRSIWQYHALSKGVWDATRYLSRLDTPFTAAQLTTAKNLALRGSIDTSRPIQFAHWATSVNTNLDAPNTNLVVGFDNTAGGTTCLLRGPCVNAAAPNGIKVITVIATVNPPAGEFPLMSAFGLGAVRYTARHQARKIGE
jgi:Flp pilus assembly protein TadG